MPPNTFFFPQQPNVTITYDENNYITEIVGTRNDGTEINNTDPLNPRNGKKISMKILDTPIVKKLRAEPFLFKKIPQPNEIEARFIRVVDLFVELATETGSWSGKKVNASFTTPNTPFTGDGIWKKVGLSEYNNIVKFLYVADQVGFYDLAKRQRKEYKVAVPTDIKKRRQEADISEFEKDPYVGTWLGRIYKPDDPQADESGFVKKQKKFKDSPKDARTLRQALILLDMTPEEFLAGSKESSVASEIADEPQKKIELLTDRLEEKTFTAVGIEHDAFPNKISLVEWASLPFIPTETDIEDKEGKMKRVKFSQQRDGRFDPSNMGVQKKLTKMMRHFAESNGITGAWTQLWSQKTPIAKHGELDIDIHYLKDFEDCLKAQVKFDENGEFIMMEKEFARKRNEKITKYTKVLEFPDTENTPEKYRGKVIRYKPKEKIPLILPDGNVIEPDGDYYNVKKIVTTKKDWESAFMYFKVAMDLGWRAEEAFTAGCNKSDSEKETGTKMEKLASGEEFLLLRIMTRKTAHVNRQTHGGSIVTKETMDMIMEKRRLVDEYGDPDKHSAEEALKHGVVQSYISKRVDPTRLKLVDGEWKGLPDDYGKSVPNKIHALVGDDNYFTKVGTMDLPSNHLMAKDEIDRYKENGWQIPQVKKVDKNRDKLKAIMRHCYQHVFSGDKSDMYEAYFKFHSLHALRHLFAQYWLKASAIENGGVRDFAMVMKMGHWGGIDVLMNFYGQSSNIEVTKRAMKLQKRYEELEVGERLLKEQAEQDAEIAKNLDDVDEDTTASETGDEIDPESGEPSESQSQQVEDDNQ